MSATRSARISVDGRGRQAVVGGFQRAGPVDERLERASATSSASDRGV